MDLIKNPVLPGFNPDPSILRVGSDYFIAVSTFEWFPGILIYHSKDLKNWRLAARPLNRTSQLDMQGILSSGGVWAPNLSFHNGRFYLFYTIVKNFRTGLFNDSHNYIVSAGDIDGIWSEPAYIHSRGIDPSLFYDDDGRTWILNMEREHRPWKKVSGGIQLQEINIESLQPKGTVFNIFKGTEMGITEGPNLYKHNGWYYLITAEGGTGWGHAVTVARSRKITGPYELDPENPMLTSRNDSRPVLQKSGHASLVETQKGEWYMAHLCSRPLPSRGRCILGRETAIQKVFWDSEGWLRLEGQENTPRLEVPPPDLEEQVWPAEPVRDDFNSPELNIHFQFLRVPLTEASLSLIERPGFLRLKGRESLSSLHHQTLIARRQQAFCYRAAACVEFIPDSYKQMAGLICYYDTINFYYLFISHDEELGKCIAIMVCDNGRFSYPLGSGIGIEGWERVFLQVRVAYSQLQFYYSNTGASESWKKAGSIFDASTLSDDYYELCGQMRFTGAFVGLCCQDLSGRCQHADFDWFEYIEENTDNN